MKTTRRTPPVFVINLATSSERRMFMSAQLEKLGMPYSIIEAVDGTKLTEAELPSLYDRERAVRLTGSPMRPLALPEIGCSLSHLSVYKKMLEENLPSALVFEDDSLIAKDMPEISALLASYFSPESNSVVLCTHIKYYLRKNSEMLSPGNKLVLPCKIRPWFGAYGYFITRGAASVLVEKLFPVWCEADVWSLFAEKFNINVRALVPYCVGIGSLGQASTLRAGRAAALKIEKRENRRLFAGFFVKDILWRRFIQRLFVLPFVGKCQKMNRVFSGLNDFDT